MTKTEEAHQNVSDKYVKAIELWSYGLHASSDNQQQNVEADGGN